MSHIKAAVFDGWACVGSANFDAMSLRINREMNLATSDPDTVDDLLERLFYRDFRVSKEISEPTPVDWRHSLAEIIADAAL
jgi:phosphatidylserine/phosphatidylglycerophosphate/cardiolipin synthase-like enzyme